MADRLFTRAEVDALIPRLRDVMGDARDRYHQALALARALEEDRSGAGGDRMARQARAERLDGLRIELASAVEAVAALGGVVKDLDLGLVDFPGLVPGAGEDPVNLCWKLGEDAVRFWHGFDEGYAQRKPLP